MATPSMPLIDGHKHSYCTVYDTALLPVQEKIPNSQIPECTCPISHNAPFRTEIYIYVYFCSEWSIMGYDLISLVY